MEREGNMNRSRAGRTFGRVVAFYSLLVLLGVLVGCASGQSAFRQGEQSAEREMWDQAVLSYAKAVAENPGQVRYQVALDRAKLRAGAVHFDRGKRYLQSGQLELALKELQEAVILDTSNQYALVELNKVTAEIERRRRAPSDFERAQSEARRTAEMLAPPKLDPASNVPINLKFPDTPVKEVYDAIQAASGINFIYDEKLQPNNLKDKRVTNLELVNVSFEKAMDLLMLMNKHFYKVLDRRTILIAEDSKQNHTMLDDNVIRTFYLSNAETQQITGLVRTLLETRRIAENKDLNAVTLKDTPERIKVAERIIKANDKAKGEVVVDIELLELNRAKAKKLGFDLSQKSLSLAFGDGKQSVPLSNLDKLKLQANWSVGVIPTVTMDFLRTDSDSKVISRPQVRILEGETGKITIGDKVPIPTTSFNTGSTVGGNIVPMTSFTYQNVGIIIEVKPRVHHNKEITLDLKAEVSSLAGEVKSENGQSQPIIGTRTVETTIRLQDGETNLLAGLIKENDQSTLSGVPGISDIPILKRIFGSTNTTTTNTDIVLSLTPHIVRLPNIEPIDLVPLWVGTEEKTELRGVARSALGESPFAEGMNPWEEIEKELGTTPKPISPKAPKAGAGTETKPGEPSTGAAGDKTPAAKPGAQGRGNRPAAAATPAPTVGGTEPRTPSPSEAERLSRSGPTPTTTPTTPRVAAPSTAEGKAAAPAAEQLALPPAASSEEPKEEKKEKTPEKKPASVAQVRLAPEGSEVPAGGNVVVDVLISAAENVGQFNLQLRYDPKVLRFVPPAENGDFLTQGGVPVELQAVESGEGGLVVVTGARSGAVGAFGSGRLVRLRFIALAPGDAGFGFAAAQIRGMDGQALMASFRVSGMEVIP